MNLRLILLFLFVITITASSLELNAQCQDDEQSKEKIEKLRQAIIKGDLAAVKELFREGKGSIDMTHKDDKGCGFLHLAAIHGHDEIVEFFMEGHIKFNFCLSLFDNYGLTPLHWAIHQGSKEIVTLLLKNGASLAEASNTSCNPSPIEMAVASGNFEIFEILTSKKYMRSQEECVSKKFGTLLHVAIHSEQPQMLTHLLTNIEDAKLQKCLQANIETKDSKGMRPLQLAAHLGNECAIEILIKHGARVNAGEGEEGGTALHYAAKAYHAGAITLLHGKGANLNAKDSASNTAYSFINGYEENDSKNLIAKTQSLNCLFSLMNVERYEAYDRPIYNKYRPHNLVFSGGAEKGVAYVGVLEELSEKKLLSELVRTGGTSFGSIVAALVSVGYTPREIEEKMLEIDFKNFLDFRRESVSILYSFYSFCSSLVGGESLDEGQKLLHKVQKISPQILSMGFSGQSITKQAVQELVNIFYDFHDVGGFVEGEVLRLQVESLIAKKTGIEYLTFGELNKLIKKCPQKYKHLHVIATLITKDKNPEIKRFASENTTQDLEQVIISDAIRASCSIPGVFKPHVIHIKFNGKRIPVKDDGDVYVDGGILYNNPIKLFDLPYYHLNNVSDTQTNYRTLGVSFEPEGAPYSGEVSNLNSIGVTKNILWLYYNAQEFLMRSEESPKRMINILSGAPAKSGDNSLNINNNEKKHYENEPSQPTDNQPIKTSMGTTDIPFNSGLVGFELDKERKLDCIKKGRESVGQFFTSSLETEKTSQEGLERNSAKKIRKVSGEFVDPWKYEIFNIKLKTMKIQELPKVPVIPAAPIDKTPNFKTLDKKSMIKRFPSMQKNHHNAETFHVDLDHGIVITDRQNEYHVYNGKTGQSLSGAIYNFEDAFRVAKNAINGRY